MRIYSKPGYQIWWAMIGNNHVWTVYSDDSSKLFSSDNLKKVIEFFENIG